MLNQTQLTEIKDKLERTQNPLFLFDNDADGICSYILIKKALERGKGYPIKSFPTLELDYLRKVEEFGSDSLIILDYGTITQEFIEEARNKSIDITVIDHHELEIPEGIDFYTSFPTKEPTTYICQKIFNRKKDIWLAMVGCIGDVYYPEFAESFKKEYPEMIGKYKEPLDIIFNTDLGKIIMMINFGLKDTTTNIMKLMKLLENANSPQDILQENAETKHLHYKYKKSIEYLQKMSAKANVSDKMVFLEYSGQTSMSSDISNYLLQQHKDKLILVAFRKPDYYNVSIRGKRSKIILEKTMKGIEGASGGGHAEACGARIPSERFEEFKKRFLEEV